MSERAIDTEPFSCCGRSFPLFHSSSSTHECYQTMKKSARERMEEWEAEERAAIQKAQFRRKACFLKVPFSTICNASSSSDRAKPLTEDLKDAFENPQFSDVTLKAGDVEFPAHKAILSKRSRVFDSMFASGMRESLENVVDLVGMKPAIAKEMLRYMYTGKVQDMSMDRAVELYVVADKYDLPQLKMWCRNFMLRNISSDFVCDVAALADMHEDKELKIASMRAMRDNLQTVLRSEKWASLSEENPSYYLRLLQDVLLNYVCFACTQFYVNEEDFSPTQLCKSDAYLCSEMSDSDEDVFASSLNQGDEDSLFDFQAPP